MADTEALKLPKPYHPCEIRPELLNFANNRQWDLLGLTRPDEIEEIKAYNLDADGNRYYLVQWKDTWKSESSLLYCEKLLQQFWERKSNSLLNQDPLCLPSSSTITTSQSIADESNRQKEGTTDILNALEQEVVASENQDSSFTSDNLMLLPQLQDENKIERLEKKNYDSTVQGLSLAFNDNEDTVLSSDDSYAKSVDLVTQTISTRGLDTLNNNQSKETNDIELKNQHDENAENNIKQDEKQKQEKVSDKRDNEQLPKNQDQEQLAEKEDNKKPRISQVKSSIKTNENEPIKTRRSSRNISKVQLLETPKKSSVDEQTSSSESPNMKGASKRKNRPPRQSVCTTMTKKDTKQRKTRGGTKTTKTLSTIFPSKTQPLEHTEELEDVDGTEDNTNEKLKCMVCDKYLTTKHNLMKHLLTHNNNHTCQICMRTFKSTHFLKHHMDKHNTTYQYSCPICNKQFKFKNNMRGHLRKHSMEKRFECEICRKKFMGRCNLREHMKSHSDSRPFECDFCRKTYKDKGALNKHMLTHQDKKVECEICKKQFKDAAQVKRHMQFHMSWPSGFKRKATNNGGSNSEEKGKFKCKFCDKVFNHYSNMNAHINKLHKEKKVQCKQCSKMFAYQYELREHMFVHQSGGVESKFKCRFCDKYFQRSTTLKNHEQTTHLGIKRFKCEICNKQFGTKFNMKVHIEKLHNKNTRTSTPVRDKPREQNNGLVPADPGILVPPQNTVPGLVSSQVPLTTPLLRNMNTSDIIRNAMANIPELTYFPGLSTRGYQFYGIPPPDF